MKANLIKERLQTLLPDITDQEIAAITTIYNFLLPYIPEKSKVWNVAHQLPFFFMSNDLLRIAGYAKFCVSIAPLPNLNSLAALKIDAPSLFSLFSISQSGRNMDIFDLDNTVIFNRQSSIESKDGVFSSFFNIQKLYALCSSHGLDFAQSMYLIPGMKILRINGYAKTTSPANSVLTTKDKGKGKAVSHKTSGTTEQVSRKKIDNTKQDSDKIATLQVSINKIQKDLKDLNQRKSIFLINNRIRLLKKEWTKKSGTDVLSTDERTQNKTLFDQVNQLKFTRDEINTGISTKKQELQNARRDLYEARSTNTKDKEDLKIKYRVTHEHYKGIGQVEEFQVHEDLLNSGNLVFSGTDNGLVSMTESVGISLDRFRFHIQLYNRFSALSERKINTFFMFMKCTNPFSKNPLLL